jgi:hypothetical protein
MKSLAMLVLLLLSSCDYTEMQTYCRKKCFPHASNGWYQNADCICDLQKEVRR